MTTRISARIRSIPDSGLLHFFDILATMDDVLSLGIGEPDMPTPQPIREAAIASIRQGQTGYTSNAGIRELRHQVAAYLRRRYGVEYDPDGEILVTVGVSEALLAAMLALLDPGDAVLVPEPCFVAYDPSVRLAGGDPIGIPTLAAEGFQVDVARLVAASTRRTRALLIGYPSNPTGAVLRAEDIRALGDLAKIGQRLSAPTANVFDGLVESRQNIRHGGSVWNTQPKLAQLTGKIV